MSEHVTVFCKFKIPKPIGVVSIDSEEPDIKSYIKKVIAELEAGNAEFISWSEFHGDGFKPGIDQNTNTEAATFVEIMISLDKDDLHKHENQQMINKALEVLHGQTIQIVYSYRRGEECHIGFTQL